jgi:hypothetical protein
MPESTKRLERISDQEFPDEKIYIMEENQQLELGTKGHAHQY